MGTLFSILAGCLSTCVPAVHCKVVSQKPFTAKLLTAHALLGTSPIQSEQTPASVSAEA